MLSPLWRLAERWREKPQLALHVYDTTHFWASCDLAAPHWRKSRDVCVAFAGVVRVSACVLCVFVVLQTPLYAVVCLV